MHVVLISPEIPPNTGNVARLCAATQTPLHLVRPLGFFLDDKRMRRAGLDYWAHVELHMHDTLADLWRAVPIERAYFFSAKATRDYADAAFQADDVLVFGSETAGLPLELLAAHTARALTIPMSGPVRSLNLATVVGMVLGEGLRQLRAVISRGFPARSV